MKNDEIKLLRGNCLELAEQIPDGSIDMVLCDPPYGVTDCRWDSVLPFDAMWRMYERVVKANGAIALFSSQPFTTRLIHSNICQYRYTWYWVKNIKTGHVFAKVQPMRQVEEVCIFYRRKPLYQPQGLVKLDREIVHRKQAQEDAVYRLDKRANASVQRYGNYPSNVLRFDVDGGKNRVHPSQKPVPLLEYFIRTYTSRAIRCWTTAWALVPRASLACIPDGASSGWSRMSSILPLRSGGLRRLRKRRHKIRKGGEPG